MAPRRRGSGDARGRHDGAAHAAETLRAFFAIELGEEVRRAAARVAALLRAGPGGDAVRWVRPENLHVTLRFLGEIGRAEIPALVEHVRESVGELAPFRLELGGVRPFPSAQQPRVVALELEPAERLVALAGAVERGVGRAGFEPEARPFRPHLTLGRVRERGAPGGAAPAEGSPRCAVQEVVLFRSQLQRSGATYTPLERLALGGGSHP